MSSDTNNLGANEYSDNKTPERGSLLNGPPITIDTSEVKPKLVVKIEN